MNRKTTIRRHDAPCGEITLVTLVNRCGATVGLSSLGAGVTAIIVPDRYGVMSDVVIGYENAADYLSDGPCAGKITGRFANRIARGRFSLDGVEYQLAVNNGPNALHGGPTGFQNRIWDMEIIGDDTMRFSRISPAGEEGYPGTLTVSATYRWTDDNVLELELTAETDKATVVNLTNHSYFNLAGHDSGSVLDHTLKLHASTYLPTDPTLIPTGEFRPVAGTPMDFTSAHELRRDIGAEFDALRYGKGYDNCWAIDGYCQGLMQTAAALHDQRSGRLLEIITDQPAVQVYTGNWLTGSPKGKDRYDYHDYDAVAIECQDIPDAPNHPEFPSTRLNPGEKYIRHINFKFSIKTT